MPSDGPYSPDGPFFADENDKVVRPFNEAVKRDSLVGTAKSEPETEQPEEKNSEDKIITAIEEFKREQAEQQKIAEENGEKVIATVIKTDADGQERFSEIVSNAEQYHVPPSELLNDVIHERSDEDINAEI